MSFVGSALPTPGPLENSTIASSLLRVCRVHAEIKSTRPRLECFLPYDASSRVNGLNALDSSGVHLRFSESDRNTMVNFCDPFVLRRTAPEQVESDVVFTLHVTVLK